MRVSDKAIVLQCIKHGDRKVILRLFTHLHGALTAVTSVGKTSKAKVKSSNVLPLSLINVELIIKQNRDVQQLTESSCYYALQNLTGSLSKLSIAQFINEILIKCLKEQPANVHLFEFIETCIRFLNETEENYLNLHLYFMSEFSKYLGFEPQNNYSSGAPYFDCREGRFSNACLSMPFGLNEEDSRLFSEFLKTNSLKTPISTAQRKILIEVLLAYYRLHVPGFNEVRCLEVLKEVLAG